MRGNQCNSARRVVSEWGSLYSQIVRHPGGRCRRGHLYPSANVSPEVLVFANVNVDNCVAKTLRQKCGDLENWVTTGCVRSSNGFGRPFFWWEGTVWQWFGVRNLSLTNSSNIIAGTDKPWVLETPLGGHSDIGSDLQ